MSAASAVTRVEEIQGLLDAASARPGASAGFQAALDAAQQAAPGRAASAALRAVPGAGAAVPLEPGLFAAAGTPSGAAGPAPFAAEVEAAASRNGVDPALLLGLIRQESNFDPAARSPAGAAGLTQLMPATAHALGVGDPLDPAQAIEGGARYLRQQLDAFGGDVPAALAAYNAGPGAVRRFGGVPPYAETQAYVQRVMGYAEQYRGAAVSAAPFPAGLAPSTGGYGLPHSTI